MKAISSTLWIIITIITLGYTLPTAVAFVRSKRDRIAICVTNLLLGWTFLGWIIALIWALKHDA